MTEHLRPLERRILKMRSAGVATEQIAERTRRSPEHVERIIGWTEIPRTRRPSSFNRALESRILAMRREGMDHDAIGYRFGRSGSNIKQIEGLAHYRRALSLLRPST